MAIVLLYLVSVGVWVLLLRGEAENDPQHNDIAVSEDPIRAEVLVDDEEEELPEPKAVFDDVNLQSVLDSWAAGVGDKASVTLADEEGNVLASVNKDRVYFAASVYKLYVAYYGYGQVDAGAVDPKEQYINGHTRVECLDLMIRESDSPCAEKLWAELGKTNLTEQLQQIGINNTSMTNINTTSYDAAVMLARISRGEGLSEQSRDAFLNSAGNQIYRDALNKGFSDQLIVYNKIGFRELDEYHDVAIVELVDDGRKFILSVLTDGVGTKSIASLGTQIESIILD